MKLTEEDLKFEWECWGNNKPWYCVKCNTLLAADAYSFCDGSDPDLPKENWNPHEKILASAPVTFDEFVEIQRKWESERVDGSEEPDNEES